MLLARDDCRQQLPGRGSCFCGAELGSECDVQQLCPRRMPRFILLGQLRSWCLVYKIFNYWSSLISAFSNVVFQSILVFIPHHRIMKEKGDWLLKNKWCHLLYSPVDFFCIDGRLCFDASFFWLTASGGIQGSAACAMPVLCTDRQEFRMSFDVEECVLSKTLFLPTLKLK